MDSLGWLHSVPAQSLRDYADSKVGTLFKSFGFTSRGVGAGTFYTAGYYDAPATDANLDQASPTVTLGTANASYAAHAFLVAGGAGSAAGGSGAVEVEVSGTSITDAGVRTESDTEVIIADITAASTNQFAETSKKWIGQVTFTLQNASGSTQTTFSFDFNYGFNKYEDFGNRDFTLTDVEVVGSAGANDSSFDIKVYKQADSGWTYAATGFTPGGDTIVELVSTHSTESQLVNGEPFAFKYSGLSEAISGTGSEGIVIEITTGANNSVQFMNIHLGVSLST